MIDLSASATTRTRVDRDASGRVYLVQVDQRDQQHIVILDADAALNLADFILAETQKPQRVGPLRLSIHR